MVRAAFFLKEDQANAMDDLRKTKEAPANTGRDLLTTPEAQEATGNLSRMTLLRLRKSGQLGFYTLADGRSIRYSRKKHIEPYLQSREHPAHERKPRAMRFVN